MLDKSKIDTNNFERKDMYARFMNYPNPIGSFTATLNISKLIKYQHKGHKINALLNYVILKAAYQIKEFHYAQESDGLYLYKDITMMGVVFGKDEKLYLANWKFFNNFIDFENNYKKVNNEVYQNNKSSEYKDTAILSSSAFVQFPIDSAVIEMGKEITHSYFTWGSYKKRLFKYYQSITIRFHHAFFDGGHISTFFSLLQKEIDNFYL